MKNTIFKSYSKKILKSEVFVSAIIVFVLAIGIIGTSYALYMDVDTDTDYQLVNVGDLSIGFDNGDNTIDLKNMLPIEDDEAVTRSDNIFSFYIYNTGTYTADYTISLVTADGNEVDSKYINYQICRDNANNCEDVNTLSNVNDGLVYKDVLSPKKKNDPTNPSVYYFMRIWINNQYTADGAKNIKLKVVVDAKNANGNLDNNNTLSGAILNNSNTRINNNTPDMSLDNEENVLYKTQDNYGISYYFRGNSDYNYVNFNNMCFRAFRIEGDGSTKLVLYNQDNNCDSENYSIGTGEFSNVSNYESFQNKLFDYLDIMKKSIYCKSNSDSLVCSDSDIVMSYVNGVSKSEVMFSGSLLKGNYWTITKENDESGYDSNLSVSSLNEEKVIRPSIVLKSDTLVVSGNGTKNEPYVVK